MAVESRSRMISFRLTDEEYDRFRRVCVSRGLRNVSELVRAAVNQLVGEAVSEQSSPAPEMHSRVASIETRLAELTSAVARMENRLSPSHGSTLTTLQYSQSASGQ